jgi:hypothetical protein
MRNLDTPTYRSRWTPAGDADLSRRTEALANGARRALSIAAEADSRSRANTDPIRFAQSTPAASDSDEALLDRWERERR